VWCRKWLSKDGQTGRAACWECAVGLYDEHILSDSDTSTTSMTHAHECRACEHQLKCYGNGDIMVPNGWQGIIHVNDDGVRQLVSSLPGPGYGCDNSDGMPRPHSRPNSSWTLLSISFVIQ
jgi:hypothetical protein